MFLYENADGRICLIFPFHDKVLVGSTDIYVDDPEAVRCEPEEIDYMLDSVRLVFPTIQIDREQIVFQFCGVRPLPSSDRSHAGPGQPRSPLLGGVPAGGGVAFPIYSLIGGKWTTFRAFAEQVADPLLADLGLPRRSRTDSLAIGGGQGYPLTPGEQERWVARLVQQTGLARGRLATLLERYGTYAEGIAGDLAGPPRCAAAPRASL